MTGQRCVLGLRQAAVAARTRDRRRRGGGAEPVECQRCAAPFHRIKAYPSEFTVSMTVRSQLLRVFEQEDVNFLLTNRIPRRLLTQFMGWFSKIEQPAGARPVDRAMALFLRPGSERGQEAELPKHARLLHPRAQGRCASHRRSARHPGQPLRCDRRRMRRNLRHKPLSDQGISHTRWTTCSAIPRWSMRTATGVYVTLRLTSGMYHRFHAPHDCRVERVTYISGDTWNVNPIALRRVERLFCKNERCLAANEAGSDGPSRYPGSGRGHSGRQHSTAFPRCTARASSTAAPTCSGCDARFGRARKWDGSSTDRPSSCSRPATSR